MNKKMGKKIAGAVLGFAVAAALFATVAVESLAYTQTTGTVSQDNVKVRESASTTATQVSSLKQGDKVDIVDEATDSSGYVWYKIYVNKNEFGYVRSDLVNKPGGPSTTASSASNTSAASLPDTQATATEQRLATVTSDSVNVRKGAGTAYDSVGKVTKGNTVTITGEATGTDNKTWYQVTFGDGKTGFVRNDLVEVSEAPVDNGEGAENVDGENQEYSEGEGAEGGESEADNSSAVNSTGDGAYSLVYTSDDEGNGVWYLYDNEGGYRVKVKELIEAAQSAEAVNKLRKSADNYKKITIALAILALVLVAGIVFLALKLRDSLYYEDEEEEEYDRYAQPSRNRTVTPSRERERPSRDEEDDRPARRNAEHERPSRRPAEEERTVRPSRRNSDEYENRSFRRNDENERQARPSRRPVAEEPATSSARRDVDLDLEESSGRPLRDAENRQARRRNSEETREAAPRRKARNFIGDDDDFEFEFLDLDDDK